MTVLELATLIASGAGLMRTDAEILADRYLLAQAVVEIAREVREMRQLLKDRELEAKEEYD